MVPEHYEKLGTSAVLFERAMTWLRVEGPDRVAWLQGMVSNDVARLGPGRGCLAAHLTPQGKVLALMTILADPEALWILAESAPDAPLKAQLEKLLIMEDATIGDCSADVRAFSLSGRAASDVIRIVLGSEVRLDSFSAHTVSGGVRAVRTHAGYDLIVPRDLAGRFLAEVAAAGVVTGEESLRRIVWLERGIPRWGVDVDATVTLPELGEEAIDYQKGCYIGQEVVAKIKYIGHVNRRLSGLRLEGDDVPEPGPIHREGREVGRLTSAAHSPAAGGVIALGYLRRGLESPGTEVEIVRDRRSLKAVVAGLPFVDLN